MKLPILPCAEKLKLVLSTAPMPTPMPAILKVSNCGGIPCTVFAWIADFLHGRTEKRYSRRPVKRLGTSCFTWCVSRYNVLGPLLFLILLHKRLVASCRTASLLLLQDCLRCWWHSSITHSLTQLLTHPAYLMPTPADVADLQRGPKWVFRSGSCKWLMEFNPRPSVRYQK